MGRKKQDDIENKIDNIYKQNLELISQNKSLLTEINNKTEYTKTLEQLFMFILEFFSKKNESINSNSLNSYANIKHSGFSGINNLNNFNPSNNNLNIGSKEYINNILEKSKDLFKDKECINTKGNNIISNNNPAYPMLGDNKSKNLISSFQASPRIFPNNSNNDDFQQYSNFDLFENTDVKLSRKNSNISSTPKILIDDYMNVSKSPSLMNYKISSHNFTNSSINQNKEETKTETSQNANKKDNNELGIKIDNYFD